MLDILSAQFRKRAAKADIPFNPAFAGAYDFSKAPDFGVLMRQFLDGLPDGGLVMCHPGFVDETLVSLDPLTTQRENEHAFLAGANSRRCWRRIMLHCPDIVQETARSCPVVLSHTEI